MLTLNDGRDELWQWDTGRTLAVDADCSQVHFSNTVFGRSKDVDVIDGVAVIPDILLQVDKDLNVWAFVGTAENGYTKISKTFKVNRRNKPADYVFTPTDQITLQTIQRQIGDISDLTTEAKDTLVAAINEVSESGAVLYTQQTLTDSQKKQARENIDAASSDFVINGTLNDVALTLDKTYNQIHEAVQAGKSAVLKVENHGAYFVLPLIGKSGQSYMFTTAASLSPTVTTKYTAMVGANGTSWHVNRVATYDIGGKMAQISMDSDPSQPMEIATKQYVDASGLPSVTDADNGKVLRVINSAWSAEDIPSGVQPDWNQNDGTQQDYVKNRPFYTGGPVETVLVEESTVSFAPENGVYIARLESTFVATVGETYKVSWDGTTYESTCANFNDFSVIGNLSIMGLGSDTGEPFLVAVSNSMGIQIATADTSASHTFSIGGFIPEIVKIDRKYLPQAAFITYDSSTDTYNSDLTNDELREILLNGEQVVCRRSNMCQYLTEWTKKSGGRIELIFSGGLKLWLLNDGTIEETIS